MVVFHLLWRIHTYCLYFQCPVGSVYYSIIVVHFSESPAPWMEFSINFMFDADPRSSLTLTSILGTKVRIAPVTFWTVEAVEIVLTLFFSDCSR